MRRLLHWLQTLAPRSSGTASSIASTTSTAAAFYVCIQIADPLRQTEILTDVLQKRQSLKSFGTEQREIEDIRHPYAIVISQDCDLEQDFRVRKSESLERSSGAKIAADKMIPNVLLLEALPVIELLGKVGGKDIRKRVENNKDERYHVLQKVEPADDAQGDGLPSLGVDFKRFFTVPTDELYLQLESNAKRHAYLASPYLEHLSKRFADFQSRVALPADHKID